MILEVQAFHIPSKASLVSDIYVHICMYTGLHSSRNVHHSLVLSAEQAKGI